MTALLMLGIVSPQSEATEAIVRKAYLRPFGAKFILRIEDT